MFRYYCIMRPPAPGAIPKGALRAKSYSDRNYIPEIDRMAWGYVEYDEALTCDDIRNFELIAAPRDSNELTASELAYERKMVYDYVKLNALRLPRYWQKKGTKVCIDGICCMLARGTFSPEAIAEFYECPVILVKQINRVYKKTIAEYVEQHKECVELFGQRYLSNSPDKYNDDSFVSLLSRIFERDYEEDDDED